MEITIVVAVVLGLVALFVLLRSMRTLLFAFSQPASLAMYLTKMHPNLHDGHAQTITVLLAATSLLSCRRLFRFFQ